MLEEKAADPMNQSKRSLEHLKFTQSEYLRLNLNAAVVTEFYKNARSLEVVTQELGRVVPRSNSTFLMIIDQLYDRSFKFVAAIFGFNLIENV